MLILQVMLVTKRSTDTLKGYAKLRIVKTTLIKALLTH